MIDLNRWRKRWNSSDLRRAATLPEILPSSPWPSLGMLALGLLAGAALGGYVVSQRTQMKRLARHARRMGDELASLSRTEVVKPVAAATPGRTNHRRKAAASRV